MMLKPEPSYADSEKCFHQRFFKFFKGKTVLVWGKKQWMKKVIETKTVNILLQHFPLSAWWSIYSVMAYFQKAPQLHQPQSLPQLFHSLTLSFFSVMTFRMMIHIVQTIYNLMHPFQNIACHWKRNEREEELWLLRKIEEGYLRSGADEKDCCAACFMNIEFFFILLLDAFTFTIC